ncbi:MAG TPA: diacylglycerol kinase family protein [Capsulimonadaceae bacterium]|jgi:YegS/Rv2252/BmrU family lipid kinase
MKTLLILNETAGQHRNEDAVGAIRDAFGSRMPQLALTQAAGDAERIARDAAATGDYDAIVAVGGDGTVNEVVNGIMSGSQPDSRPALGVIPTGTCNILASELGIPWPDVAAAADVVLTGKSTQIDLCLSRDRYFLLMASFGLDAEAVRGVERQIKQLVGPGAYVVSGLAAFANYKPSHVRLRLDDDLVDLQAFMVVVANVSTYALSSVKIAPFARPDDGWLDICVFEKPPMRHIGFIAQVMLMLARRHIGDPRVRYYRARRIEIDATPPIAAQIDGDPIGETPLTIEIVPKALSVLIPSFVTS